MADNKDENNSLKNKKSCNKKAKKTAVVVGCIIISPLIIVCVFGILVHQIFTSESKYNRTCEIYKSNEASGIYG